MKIKNFIKNNYKFLLFLILFSSFIIIAKDVFKKEIYFSDQKIYNFFVLHRNKGLNIFFTTITELGSAEFLIFFTILSVILFKNKFYKIIVPLNLAFIGGFNQILKHIFVRPRPNQLRLIEENGYSFPSGHAMASTAFYGLLIMFAFKHLKNKKIRNMVCIALGLLILFIDISRIYVGVHYTSDVFAGTCLSIAYLIILNKIIKERTEKKEEDKIEEKKNTEKELIEL